MTNPQYPRNYENPESKVGTSMSYAYTIKPPLRRCVTIHRPWIYLPLHYTYPPYLPQQPHPHHWTPQWIVVKPGHTSQICLPQFRPLLLISHQLTIKTYASLSNTNRNSATIQMDHLYLPKHLPKNNGFVKKQAMGSIIHSKISKSHKDYHDSKIF